MEMKQRVSAFVYWAPRVLSIMFIAFLALFSLDVITPESSLKEIIVGLIMHNIPVFIMIIVLVIAWKHEIVGAIAFLLAGVIYVVFTTRSGLDWRIALSWSMTIAGPAFLIGGLFLVNWLRKRQT
jgi:thiol:disulfide interchange protein